MTDSLTSPVPGSMAKEKIKGAHDDYMTYFADSQDAIERRKKESSSMTQKFYDLVTDFYQYGWGDSFHFAPRTPEETFREGIKRHEHFLALKLGLKSGMTCLDLGCGVGGPMTEIGSFSGASVIGVNNNTYQLSKCNEKIARAALSNTCKTICADFMALPFPDNSQDAAYQIEATCHASDRTACYAEVCRVLKPGQCFAGYEWVTLPAYDQNNAEHRSILHGIEVGNGLPPTYTSEAVLRSLEEAGFEVLEYGDKNTDPRYPVPWYEPLNGSISLTGLRHTRAGRWLTHTSVSWLERLRLIPTGTTDVSGLLMMTADALVNSGKKGIFTPCFFYIARKKEQ